MLKNQNLENKRVIVRVDFNVPLDTKQQITDHTRIVAALPTINNLSNRGAVVILVSHLGRPLKDLNEDKSFKPKYSLIHLVNELSVLLGKKVYFFNQSIIGDGLSEMINNCTAGDIVLLENIRFYPEEEKGGHEFSKYLAKLGDFYVNDAFGTAHREHASTATIARYFDKKKKDFGLLMGLEVTNLKKLLFDPLSPFTAIIGGAKVSDKIVVLDNLLQKVDNILIGGGMAFTFIKALGGEIGGSIVEEDKIDVALLFLKKAKEANVNVILPKDVVIGNSWGNDCQIQISEIDKIPNGWAGYDIGSQTLSDFQAVIETSNTILWNGPMGVFEFSNFSNGTLSIGEALAKVTERGAFTVVGGGDSVAAINKNRLENKISFISTGGGAMLEMIEGKVLPGISAMQEELL